MSLYHLYIYDGTYHAANKILFQCLDLPHPQKTVKSLKGKPYPPLYSKHLSRQCQLLQTHNKPWDKLLMFTATDIISLILIVS